MEAMRSLLLIFLLTLGALAQPLVGIARLEATPEHRAHGTLWFIQKGDKVRVVAHIIGLRTETNHSLHIHQLWKSPAVDLGTLQPDFRGVADLDVTLDNQQIVALMGRPVTLHESTSELSANAAVGKIVEADARAMQEMPGQPVLGSPSR